MGGDAADEHGLYASPQPFESRMVVGMRGGEGIARRDATSADHSLGCDILYCRVPQHPAPLTPRSFCIISRTSRAPVVVGQVHDVGRVPSEGVNVGVGQSLIGGVTVGVAALSLLLHEVLHGGPDSLLMRRWLIIDFEGTRGGGIVGRQG